MARTHTVAAGETLSRLAVRYYGAPERWPEIARANQQLTGRASAYDGSPFIYPGDVLIIPGGSGGADASGGARQTVVLDENAPQDLSLTIGGKKFTGFTGYTLVESVHGVDAFSFSVPWDSGRAELRSAFRPFVYHDCTLTYDGDVIFNGVVLPPAAQLSPSATSLNVQGYPRCGVLIDSCLPDSLYPMEYSGLSLAQIARTVCQPFGVGVTVQGDTGAAFDKVDAELSDKAWDFLNKLAEQRGLFLSNTADGGLLIYKPETEAVSATFVQGEAPLISCAPTFDGQKMYSHITGFTKTTEEAKSEKYTYQNRYLIDRGVLRCYAKAIDDADGGTLEQSVKALAGEMFANCVRYKLEVSGHRDKNGKLYRKNMAVSVKAPGAEIYRETKLLADEVTLKRDDSAGARTEFSLVLPGSRNGSLPEVFPWEE